MPASTTKSFLFDPGTAGELACPACLGDLRLEGTRLGTRLICVSCGRSYPVVDGIPVLIAERAEMGEAR
jgi:uncharacterized protein YbaR (Trm112 family)